MALLAFDNVSFSYPGSSAPALRGVSLQLQAGEYLAVLGANGSGKSTLALHMNGLLRPSEGSVSLQLRPHLLRLCARPAARLAPQGASPPAAARL